MENPQRKAFQNSLDLTSDDLENHIPDLLSGLWELGSMPEYIIEPIDRNDLGTGNKIIDLGCGKGAVLIKLAEKSDIKGIGIDIIPAFIEEAVKYAREYGVSDRIEFKAADIIETIKTTHKHDLVIYGYDSEILGGLGDTLRRLSTCIKRDGFMLLEFMFAERSIEGIISCDEMKATIERAGYHILDRIDWNREAIKLTNSRNTAIIEKNVKRLLLQYPGKKELFKNYLKNQIDECLELENDYTCTTLLLRQKNYGV